MKFIHIADMHFDMPFTFLDSECNLGEIRRLSQRKVFKNIIEYIKENNIEYLFIAGDLYENEYIKESTIKYINSLFMEIPNTKIFITPGNHDPFIRNSYYAKFNWAQNVYIFNEKLEKYEDNYLNIFGYGFNDFYMESLNLDNFILPVSNKPNIFISHVDLNGNINKDGFSYNPVLESKLNSIGFDYCAIGHIHKKYISVNKHIVYPGSTISLGFDEPGEHGMIVGNIDKYGVQTEFIKLDDMEFEIKNIDVTNSFSQEELIEKINSIYLSENNMYEIILSGKRNFEINLNLIKKCIISKNILKVKDETSSNFDIEEIANENNLRGLYIRKILEEYKKGNYSEKEIEKAIEIGLNAMN